MDSLSENQRTDFKLGQYTSHVFKQKPINYESVISNRSYVTVDFGQLRGLEADMR